MKSLVITLLAIFIFSTAASAGLITKIKKNRFIFSMEGLENIKKGSWVEVETEAGNKVLAKVLKKNKRSALAKLRRSKDRKKISLGNNVTLKVRSNKVSDSNSNSKLEQGHNGFFIEPFINAYISTYKQNFTFTGSIEGTSVDSSSAMGLNLGSLIGYKYNSWYFSPNLSLTKGSISSQESKFDTTPSFATINYEDNSFTKNTLGVYLGYQVTKKTRIWVTGNLITLETVTSSDLITIFKGMSFTAGANWELKENLFLNLSAGMSQYTEKDGIPLPKIVNVSGTDITSEALTELQILAGLSYYFSFAK